MWDAKARLRDFALRTPLWPDDLNSLQDRTINVYASRTTVRVTAVPEVASGAPTWVIDPANPHCGWTLASVGGRLWFFVASRQHMRVSDVKVRYYNSHPSSAMTPSIELLAVDIGSGSAPPTKSPIGANYTALPSGAWGDLPIEATSGTPITPVEISERIYLVLEVDGTTVSGGDYVTGVVMTGELIVAH